MAADAEHHQEQPDGVRQRCRSAAEEQDQVRHDREGQQLDQQGVAPWPAALADMPKGRTDDVADPQGVDQEHIRRAEFVLLRSHGCPPSGQRISCGIASTAGGRPESATKASVIQPSAAAPPGGTNHPLRPQPGETTDSWKVMPPPKLGCRRDRISGRTRPRTPTPRAVSDGSAHKVPRRTVA